MQTRICRFTTLAALSAFTILPAFALTVPVAEDASSTITNGITPTSGKGTSLPVNAKQTAFIRFNIANLASVPATITPGNLTSATLRLYVSSAKPGDLTLHSVTSNWTEKPVGKSAPLPSIDPTVIATLPSASLLGKHFISVDVTTQVKAWLTTPATDFGFAIQTTDAKAKVSLGSKEGLGVGEPAVLDLEANLAESATGAVTVSGDLNVSNAFVVEARPTNTGDFDIFIGSHAGEDNTTGMGNTFVGHNSGKANTTGDSNSFFGLNAGQGNTTGQLNTFLGQGSGAFNTTGNRNTFVGHAAGFSSLSASDNSFFGWKAGFATGTGTNNTFFGSQAGLSNTASNNAFFGAGSGALNTSGTQNCYFGINAGSKTTGSFNAFFGAGAGEFTTTGQGNTFFGNIAGSSNSSGSNNTFLGGNTGGSITTESGMLLLGDSADGAASITNSTAIGSNAKVTASNSLVLGSISGINGASNSTKVGIGVTSPASTLSVNGSLAVAIRSSSGVLNALSDTDCVFVFTGSTVGSGISLPTAAGVAGRTYFVKNRGSVPFGLYTVVNQTIDGTNNTSSPLNIPANSMVQVVSDGANWVRLN